ncbi:gamma-glutamyltransferase [Desulfonema ishimotonii]|uniref:Gamma-glutamyltransferase n=1 Tax=Desulfonema ishimotonii TaxID=45657 RepID=A0A401G280_9BACT|nr:gamma-glutamyltransferase family protein [Desulfonema ishimotonii]GBC63339.1 gamma-glutamyltransferase [Desulfonema ishimotonii]
MKRLAVTILTGTILLFAPDWTAAEDSVATPNGAMRPTVQVLNCAVSAPDQYCALAAMEMYQKGGNAIDAGIAATIVSKVTQHCHDSWGGETPMLIYHAATGKNTFITGSGPAPHLATLEYFQKKYKGIPTQDCIDISSVPGSLAGLALALEKYGTLTLEDVMAPAIRLSEEGFPISPIQVKWLKKFEKVYTKWPDSRRLFMPDGTMLTPGDIFRQPDMAHMMKEMVTAAKGHKDRKNGIRAAVEYFYKGPVAKEIDRFMKSVPDAGLLRYNDFADFIDNVPQEYEPLHTTYKDSKGNLYDIYTTNTLTQAPALLMALNILDTFDIGAMTHNSAEYLHLITETLNLVMADRYKYFGDPDRVQVPAEALVSKAYADVRRPLIDLKHAAPHYQPGDPRNMKASLASAAEKINFAQAKSVPDDWETGTIQLTTMDKDGNMFSTTSSNNMGIKVTGVVPGNVGFLLSGRLRMFYTDPESANQLGPFKRPRITPCPAIAFKNGKPWMAFGTPGGDQQVQTMLQVFMNIVEFDMMPQNAVEQFRIRSFAFPKAYYPGEVLDYQMGIGDMASDTVLSGLKTLGHIVKIENTWKEPYGGVCLINMDPATGVLSAGADPRRECYALGF